MIRRYHYEAAFEHFLRSRAVPYIAVDEHKRAVFAGSRVKSFDFLVYLSPGKPWLVDIKGRMFPYLSDDGQKRYWENWVTRDDLDGLARWQEAFGEGFAAMLVFAYWLREEDHRRLTSETHVFRQQEYAFLAISLDEYRAFCRHRSSRWDTVFLPADRFRQLAVPVQDAVSDLFTRGCPTV